MIKKVTCCADCPFYVDVYYFCNLDVAIELKPGDEKSLPTNCPLRKEIIIVQS